MTIDNDEYDEVFPKEKWREMVLMPLLPEVFVDVVAQSFYYC